MDETRSRMEFSFGRTYRMLEAMVRADFGETMKRAMTMTFGSSPEFKLIEALARATEPLSLTEIAVRSGATRRAISPLGSLRRALERMNRAGIVINVGSPRKPLYRMNLANAESQLFTSLFQYDLGSAIRPD